MGHNSLDGYLYLRFFKLLIGICLGGICITWPILFPINATGGGGQSQLDLLSFANVADSVRFYAHALVAWVFLGGVMLAITHERMFYIGARQAYYMSPLRAKRLTSRTVMFMSLPEEDRSEHALRKLLGRTVRRVWMASDVKDLQDEVDDRDKAAINLEKAESKLIQSATEQRLKSMTNDKAQPSKEHAGSQAQTWLKEQKRPTHRLKPLIGKKVDTLEYARDYLPKQNNEIVKMQQGMLKGEHYVGTAFVEFESQYAAQRAFQMAVPSKKNFKPRMIDVQPEEVIWKNLKRNYASIKGLMFLAGSAMVLVTIFWTPLIAFVGILTNINSLTNKVPFLSFINDIPGPILGVVTGLLPTILLTVMIILVPIICRLLAKLAGAPTLSEVELKTQSWYFVFQVIQVFLVTTFTSGASAVVTTIINDPTQAPTLLAKNLPKASNFYISYFILYGLAQSALQLLMIVPLILSVVLGKLLDKTPRKRYTRWTSLAGLGWGSMYPKWANLGVIALSYSCIAPLVLGFAAAGFLLLYLAFRHQWLFVLGNKIDMKGEAYCRALQQLTVGIYLATICLIGLFAIATASSTAATGPLVLMIVFLVVLIVFQVLTDRALGPLEQTLPLDMLRENEASMWTAPLKQQQHFDHHQGDDRINGANAVNGEKNSRYTIGNNTNSHPHTQRAVEQSTSHSSERDAEKGREPEYEGDAKDNVLTRRARPIIHKRFYAPAAHTQSIANSSATLESDWMEDESIAYLAPCISCEPPIIWLPRDEMGVSRVLVQENEDHGVKSTDEYAWFDIQEKKGKRKLKGIMWDTSKSIEIGRMLERREAGQGKGNTNNEANTGTVMGG